MSNLLFHLTPFIALCVAASPLKRQYIIGGWIPGDANLLMKRWTPVLQTYLTQTIGPMYDPPISFKLIPVDYTKNTLATDSVRAGDQLDFVYNAPGTLACLETEFG